MTRLSTPFNARLWPVPQVFSTAPKTQPWFENLASANSAGCCFRHQVTMYFVAIFHLFGHAREVLNRHHRIFGFEKERQVSSKAPVRRVAVSFSFSPKASQLFFKYRSIILHFELQYRFRIILEVYC